MLLQTVGNVCAGIAALIYALPLQHLLHELARKRDDGGGVLAGALLLLPMWLLLLVALLCVTAGSGLDGLGLPRAALYTLVVLATLAMTVLSFLRFEFPRHPKVTTRLIGGLPIYVLPAATMLLVILSLNPRLAMGLPPQAIRLPWLAGAVVSLALCGGFLGYRLAVTARSKLAGMVSLLRRRGAADRAILAHLANLDPQRDFTEILRHAIPYESRAVREAATAGLRRHPVFLAALAESLDSRDPGHALGFLETATLSPAEQNRLALPARSAIDRFTSDLPAPNYMSSDRRKQLSRWGRKALPVIAKKFAATTVDFAPTLAAFEQALAPPQNLRK